MVTARAGRRSRRAWGITLGAVASVIALAGCSTPQPAFVTPQPLSAKLIFSHEDQTTDVSPGLPVTVEVVNGELSEVTLSTESGEVPGTFAPDRTYWRTSGGLGFGQSYTLQVTGLGEDEKPVEESRTFSTLAVPQGHYWGVTFNSGGGKHYSVPLDGGTFGVGQPIIARFTDVPDRRVAESNIVVKTDKPVEGAWSWINEYEMHWRPKEYWPAYTKVTVEANILGVRVVSPKGNRTLYGDKNVTASFSIGQSRIAKVDNNTHLMTVWIDGEQAAVQNGRGCDYSGAENFGCVNGQQLAIRVSLGQNRVYTDISGRKNNYNTQSGIHVVTEKGNPVIMEGGGPCPSKTKGAPDCDPEWYREIIPHAVRLTDSGVYVHSASWSTGDQGYRNVSHGCVNIHPRDAEWFFALWDKGDIVEIANTGRQVEENNGTTDWNKTWEEWVAGSATYRA